LSFARASLKHLKAEREMLTAWYRWSILQNKEKKTLLSPLNPLL
jgi:hypothetical protein